MKEASALYRLLGDEARLRLLRVLDQDRFNVKELTGILGLAQSGVSRHLGLLKEAGPRRRRARRRLHLLSPVARRFATTARARCGRCCRRSSRRRRHRALVKADEARLQEVLRLRRENFEHVGPDTRDGRQLVPGRSWAAWSRALGHVAAAARGRGPRMRRGLPDGRNRALGAARDRRRSLDRACWRAPRRWPRARSSRTSRGRRASSKSCRSTTRRWTSRCCRRRCITPASRPARWPKRARILKPGGRLLILDLRPHDETWVREKLGDQWFGFSDDHLDGPADARRLHRRPRRARRAADQRSVRGAARGRHEAEQEITNNELNEDDDDTRHPRTTARQNASSCWMARWARWSSGAS